MRSLIIGIARTGKPFNYVLNEDTKYISMCGSNPEVNFSINCGQDEFIRFINRLRYDDADPSSSAEAIDFFQNLATKLFKDLKYLKIEDDDLSPLHIRLVTTPFELAQIPFEFALTSNNIANEEKVSLFANPKRKITLTREVRQESVVRYKWPHKPRILFAWAAPLNTVPHEEHREALADILKPLAKPKADLAYPEPNISEFLTELPNASLESLRKTIAEGITEGRPYTHINILAHGGQVTGLGVMEFRLILCRDGTTDEKQKVDGVTLANAIVSTDHDYTPTVVSLSACDSGNLGNTILPAGSLVYQIHNAGVPCVFASQFPLTQQGSVKMVKTLYDQLINASDPRKALYETRIVLKKDPTHDWASLVAYARFPEEINQQLQDAQLKNAFSSMKTTNAWVDHVFKFKEQILPELIEKAVNGLELRLDKSIDQLSEFLSENRMESTLLTGELQAEHLGLLGSGYKRKAEYLFRLIDFNPIKKENLKSRSASAIIKAREFYKLGFEANAASHWNAMQYLSLKAVSMGTLRDEKELWPVVKYMAKKSELSAKNEEDRIWAWGTLTELYLLKPLTEHQALFDETSLVMAKEYMDKIAASGAEFNSAKESTARQFERYINWWPILFSETYPKIIQEMAIEIRSILPTSDLLS